MAGRPRAAARAAGLGRVGLALGLGPASAASSDRLNRLLEVILDEMVGEEP